MKVFSEDWANAYHNAITLNQAYTKSGENWELGKLALVLDDKAVVLDLYKGECRSVISTTSKEAENSASFIIVGKENTWKEVLSGQLAPLMGIMSGKLKLAKGSISKLMPFAKAAIDLVNSAQTLETEF